jgi:hypothetical protein
VLVDEGGDGQFAAVLGAFADAVYALVGDDLHDDEALLVGAGDDGSDFLDLHGYSG